MVSALVAHVVPTAFASLLLLLQPVSAVEVRFFYSPLRDSCAWGGTNTFPATNNTANGGVCAYVPSRNRLFACPAPDDNCWGFNVNCQGGSNATPGDNQILCGRSNGQQWCCGEDEACTLSPGQVNVCIPNFKSPNAGVSPADAREKEFSALPAASIVTSLPTQTPSVFSVLSPSTSSASRTASRSSTGNNSNNNNNPGATSDASNNNGNRTNKNGDRGGISGGAIAGIVIGAIAGILLIVGLVIFLLKRRRNGKAMGPDGGYYEKSRGEDFNSQYPPSTADGGQTPASQYPHSGYYGGEVYAKVAPEDQMSAQMPPHQEPVEMPVNTKPHELP